MRCIKPVILLLIFIVAWTGSSGQAKRPKIGLVLSGGGARGMAHIGILKAMEKAGLQPDYITGTSMGSIIGGLYAIGYTADELEQLLTGLDWDQVLTNRIGWDKISMEEKNWYGRFAIDVPTSQIFKPKLPSGVIEGERLQELLSSYTRRVHGVEDFSQFPIPFACVGTDIATGTPVVLSKGNLARSLRASMAIPAVFTPVLINDTLLVDGGLVRNFPVEEIKKMGADIVIGVFVSTELSNKSKLDNMVSILMQSTFVMSATDSEKQKKELDFYIQPDLTGFGAADFKYARKIVDQGLIMGDSCYPYLKKLADSLNDIAPQIVVKAPVVIDEYLVEDIVIKGNKKIPQNLIKGKLKIKTGEKLTIKKMEDKITLLFGTGQFANVWYRLIKRDPDKESSGYVMELEVKEATPARLKAAVHYDSENKAGINLNYTLRNVLLPNSRMAAELTLSEYPRVNVNYLKYVGTYQRTAAAVDINFESFQAFANNTSSGTRDLFNIVQGVIKGSLFTTAQVNSSFGLDLAYNEVVLKPKVTGSALLAKVDYLRDLAGSVQFYFRQNSHNSRYYPTKGTMASVSLNYIFGGNTKLKIEVDSNTYTFKQGVADVLQVQAVYNKLIPLHKRVTLAATGSVLLSLLDDEIGFSTLGHHYFGGFKPRIANAQAFYGAQNYDYSTSSHAIARLDIQWQLHRHIFTTAGINYLNIKYPMDWLGSKTYKKNYLGADYTSRMGYGLSIGYMTFIGPIAIAAGMDSRHQKLNANVSMGFHL
jgi:NTE family protein